MNEAVLADAWIYTTLSGDAALAALVQGVHADFAPEGALYPLVTFHLQAASDVNYTGANRAMVKPLYLVRVVGQGSGYAAIQAAASRIDLLLTVRVPVAVTLGGETATILGCMRERPFQTAYLASGVRTNELGGLYRLNIAAG